MALSQAYLAWEKETEQRGMERGMERGIERGMERGKQQTQQMTITSILTTRFGGLDRELESILPTVMDLPIEFTTPLLIQLSREELLERFAS